MLWTKMCFAWNLHIISYHKGHFLGWNWTHINQEEIEEALAELETDCKEVKPT